MTFRKTLINLEVKEINTIFQKGYIKSIKSYSKYV